MNLYADLDVLVESVVREVRAGNEGRFAIANHRLLEITCAGSAFWKLQDINEPIFEIE
jgi:hypothetical protein